MSRRLSRLIESLESPGAESRRAITAGPPAAVKSLLDTVPKAPPPVSSFLLATSFMELNVLCSQGGHELRAVCNSDTAACS